MILWDILRERMMHNLSQRLCEDEAEITYEELIVFAEHVASQICGEACCAIYCHSEMAVAMSILACLAADVTAVPLSARYGEKHTKRILRHINPTCLITDLEGDYGIYKISDSEYTSPKKRPAFIMCTSGTTGAPKGVMLSETGILTNIRDISGYMKIGHNDSILIARSLYHSAVLTGEFLTSLYNGAKIVFHSGSFNPAIISKLIIRHNITVFCGTPTLISMFSRLVGSSAKDYLKHIVISGECMNKETGRKIVEAFPKSMFYSVYGLTEASPRVSYLPPEYFDRYSDCVGIPLANVNIKIVDSHGNKVKNGKPGILWVKGPNVMLGYYNDRELTKSVMKNNWLCTGDIAVRTKMGWLKIIGRSDDMIIRAGMNIYPVEIENELLKDPRVREVVAFGYSDDGPSERIGLMISGDFTDINEVKQLCISVLPDYQIPSKIKLLDEIPKNESGKIIRRPTNV